MSPVPTRSAHARYTLSLWSASTAIDSVDPTRSCPSVGALDQGMVTWIATRRPGRWSDGSTRSRKGVAVVAHHDDVARDVRSRVRAPPEVRDVYGVILCHGGPDGRTILPRGVAGFDAPGRIGGAPVERHVDGGGPAVRCVEIIEAHVHAIGVADGAGAHEGLIDVGAERLQRHGRGR